MFRISIWEGLEMCLGGLSPQMPPRGDEIPEDISFVKQYAGWNSVKMRMILLFYYVVFQMKRFIFKIYLLGDHSKMLLFNKSLQKSIFNVERAHHFLSQQCSTLV